MGHGILKGYRVLYYHLDFQWSFLKYPAGDHQSLDLTGSFSYCHQSRGFIHGFDWIFPAVAVSSMDLDSAVGGSFSHLSGKEFGQRTCLGVGLSLVPEPSRIVDHQPGSVDISCSVRNQPLNCLVFFQGFALWLRLII